MPLDAPLLDDRRYDELYDELRRRIAVYNPGWTDHNDSDPGITLLQLFAFMGEGLLYRLNQVPEATQLAFLKLLDIRLRPATAARAMLAFGTDDPQGATVEAGMTALAGKLPFRIGSECQVWPIAATAVARLAAPLPQNTEDAAALGTADDPELFDTTRIRVEALRARLAAQGIDPAGQQPVGYAPAYLKDGEAGTLDFRTSVDRTLWIALRRTADQLPQRTPGNSDPITVSLGFDLVEDGVTFGATQPCGDAATPTRGLIWEIGRPRPDASGVDYQRLDVLEDSTVGLAQAGITRLKLPEWAIDAPPPYHPDDFVAGTGDWPPPLDADEDTLWLWLRAYRTDGVPPPLSLVAANAGMAVQASKAEREILGVGTGQPGQQLALAHAPVLADRDQFPVQLQVEEAGRWTNWQQIDDVAMAASDQRAFALDAEAGQVRFGARAPEIAERVQVVSYHYGGGRAGNVPPGAISKLAELPSVRVTNVTRGRGGEDAETMDAALKRLPGEIRRRDRAVTAEDFSELALLTPGAGLARAECLPRFHPPTRRSEQAGMVTVIVWPRDETFSLPQPKPDRATIGMVCRYLSARRLVTTELYVAPPDYVEVAVSVKLAVEPGYGLVAISRWVEKILQQFLSPLPPYGPDGGGWPLGRRVNPRELEATVLQIEGIDFIEELQVARRDGGAWSAPGPVNIERWQVVALTRVVVVGPGDPLPPPGSGVPPPPTGNIMPIPVIREVC